MENKLEKIDTERMQISLKKNIVDTLQKLSRLQGLSKSAIIALAIQKMSESMSLEKKA